MRPRQFFLEIIVFSPSQGLEEKYGEGCDGFDIFTAQEGKGVVEGL